MITGARRKSLSLAGLMPPCSGFKTLAKLSFPFSDKGNYFPRIAGGGNCIATSDSRAALTFVTSTREFKDTLAASFKTSTRELHHTCSNEFLESIKKGLMFDYIPVYGYSAPAKSGAGFRSPEMYRAIHDAPSVFFCVVSQAHTFFSDVVIIRVAHKIMVGWAGQPKGWPVSLYAGTANPVQSITIEFRSSGDGCNTPYKEAATWLLPLPKIRNLSGLSPLFAAICRQLPQKFTISPQNQSRKPAAHWHVITSVSLQAVSVWRWQHEPV